MNHKAMELFSWAKSLKNEVINRRDPREVIKAAKSVRILANEIIEGVKEVARFCPECSFEMTAISTGCSIHESERKGKNEILCDGDIKGL